MVRIRIVARAGERVERALTGTARLTGGAMVQRGVELMERWSQAVENTAYDLRLVLRTQLAPRRDDPRARGLLIVEIDDVSLERIGRWPWSRDRQARLIQALKQLGARGVFTDIEYLEPSDPVPGAEHPDRALARALGHLSTGRALALPLNADGAAFGVTYLESGAGRTALARAHARRQLREWVAQAATRPDAPVPGPLRDHLVAEGLEDLLREAADMHRIAGHLWEQPLASDVDMLIAGVLPEPKLPAPPPAMPIHAAQLLPAVLQAAIQDPTSPPGAVAEKAVRSLGYGSKFIEEQRDTAFTREYLPELVRFCRTARGAFERLHVLWDEVGDALKERWIRDAQSAALHADDETIMRRVSERMGLAGGEVDPRVRVVHLRRRSRDVFTGRDVVPARPDWLARLPLMGEPHPPVPVIAHAYRGLGISTVEHDVGGILRRQRLVFRVESSATDSRRDALPARLTFHATLPIIAFLGGLDLQRIELGDDYLRIPPRAGGAPLTIPVDANGRVLLDFRGKWHEDGFERVNALEVMSLVEYQERRERYLRGDGVYLGLATLTDFLDRLAGGEAPLFLPVPAPLAPATQALASTVCEQMREARMAGVRDAAAASLEQLTLDLRSLLEARDEALRAKNTAEVREVDQYLASKRVLHEFVMTRLPLLEDSLKRRVRGRFCLIGVTSTSTTDVSASPLQEQYINLGVHATLLDQMLTGTYVIRAPWLEVDLPILIGCLLLVALIVPLLSIRKGSVAIAFLVVGHVVVSAWFLIVRGVWIDATTPVLAMALAYMGITLRRYLMEERQKNRIRSMFSTYLDKRVVEAMIADQSVFEAMGGQTREITSFFSDIEGFTTISELLDSDDLSTMLQDYLTPMTARILAHGGLRDKYIGDAIVAIFGAPVATSDHAAQACLASIEQLETMARLKRQWHTDGTPWFCKIRKRGLDLNFRIGLNTGRAKVGNFGSRDAKNYTMIGDTVNLASRLEGANKGYKTRVMISETTYQHARAVIEARELDLLRVIGKLQPVKVFEVLGRHGEVAPDLIALAARFKEGLDLYRARRFDDARKVFGELQQKFPEDGPVRTYVKRLEDREYLAALPPDWDGAFVSKEK